METVEITGYILFGMAVLALGISIAVGIGILVEKFIKSKKVPEYQQKYTRITAEIPFVCVLQKHALTNLGAKYFIGDPAYNAETKTKVVRITFAAIDDVEISKVEGYLQGLEVDYHLDSTSWKYWDYNTYD